MMIAFPVEEYQGLESQIYGHFGSAPSFLLLNSETMAVENLTNADQNHIHGSCSPMKALAGRKIDAVVVGGIGMGALNGLQMAGIKVYRAQTGTVADVAKALKAGSLSEFGSENTCAGHAGGVSCHCSH